VLPLLVTYAIPEGVAASAVAGTSTTPVAPIIGATASSELRLHPHDPRQRFLAMTNDLATLRKSAFSRHGSQLPTRGSTDVWETRCVSQTRLTTPDRAR
jgi:hypothetical protein